MKILPLAQDDALHPTERPALMIVIDTSVSNIEIAKVSPERMAEIRWILDNLRFSDSYYLVVSREYNSQALKYAVEEGQPARVLNEIVRKLTGAYPDIDQALSIIHSPESKGKFQE